MFDLPEPWGTVATVILYALAGALSALWGRSKLKSGGGAAPAPPAGDSLDQLRREVLYLLSMTAGGSTPPFAPDRPADAPGGPLAGALLQLAQGILSDAGKPVAASLDALRPILSLHREIAAGPAALLNGQAGKAGP